MTWVEEEFEALWKDGLPLPDAIVDEIRRVDELSRPEARDPKLAAVKFLLTEHRTEGKTWLEHGCIIFTEYYNTFFWIPSGLAGSLGDEPVAVYAGTGRSGINIRTGQSTKPPFQWLISPMTQRTNLSAREQNKMSLCLYVIPAKGMRE